MWLVCYVIGKWEFEFQRVMREKFDIETYCVTGRKRTKLRKIKKWVNINFPAFPNYVFLRHEPPIQWVNMNSFPAFLYCLGTPDGTPLMVPQRIIDRLKRAEAAHFFDDIQREGSLFSEKTLVRINQGPFIGRTAIIEEIKQSRAVINVDGRQVKINIDFLELRN